MLAGLLSVVIEKLDQISAKMDAAPPTSRNNVKATKDFISYIKHKESIAEILRLLHNWIDDKEKVKALVYLKAAIDANVISRPPYDAANEEFPGRLGSKSLYYVYTGEPFAFSDTEDIETLKCAIQELRTCTDLN